MNLFAVDYMVSKKDREFIKNQKSCVIWMCGLSGSGKTTIANKLESELVKYRNHTYILDGDNTRLGLNKNLGFSESDRIENIRRVAEVCKLMNEAGLIVICSFISPFEINRNQAREIIGEDFIEIYIKTSLNTCEKRDPKGLYKKARTGEIKDFTGITSPFEEPKNCLTLINEEENDLEKNVMIIINHLKNNNYINE